MDINATLAAEINLAWLSYALDEMKLDLHELLDDIDADDDEYLDDINGDIQSALVKIEQSLGGIIEELESIYTTADRLCECIKLHTMEIKPCWNVYQKLREQVVGIKFEPQEHDSDSLEKQLAQLRQDIRSIKVAMYEVEDYLDLPDDVKKMFLLLADNINKEANAKYETLYEGALLLCAVFSQACDYIDCQKNSNKESCLRELDKLCQAVSEYKACWR